MTIKIDEFYRIESDLSSWNLVFEKEGEINNRTGKRKMSKEITYHANLKQALQKYCDENLKTCASIAEVVQKIDELNQKIESLNLSNVR